VILTKSHLTFGQITKLQLTRSYLPTGWALPHRVQRASIGVLDVLAHRWKQAVR